MKKKIVLISITLLSLIIYSSCKKSSITKSGKPNAAITIAVFTPAGLDKQKQEHYLNGIKLAEDNINRNNGLLGEKVKILQMDDMDNIKESLNLAVSLSKNSDIAAVIGSNNPYIASATSLIFTDMNIITIYPLTTEPENIQKETNDLSFRTIAPKKEFKDKLFRYGANHGFKYCGVIDSLMVISDTTSSGRQLDAEYDQYYGKYGMNITGTISFPNTTLLKDGLKLFHNIYDIDTIYINSQGEKAMDILNLSREIGYKIPFFCSPETTYEDIKEHAIDKTDIVYCSYYDSLNPVKENIEFKKQYDKKYHSQADQFAAQGYDAVNIIAEAISIAKTADGKKVAEQVKKNKFKGVTGSISFNDSGERKSNVIIINKFK